MNKHSHEDEGGEFGIFEGKLKRFASTNSHRCDITFAFSKSFMNLCDITFLNFLVSAVTTSTLEDSIELQTCSLPVLAASPLVQATHLGSHFRMELALS